MTYAETLEFLFSQLPMYQRIGAAAYKTDLNTTIELLAALGNPQHTDIHFIHVAGTNGKGSVSHMMASVLQEAGFSTGLFTSPHLKDFRERIRINGQMISEEEVIRFVEENRDVFTRIQPSFFEMTAALALLSFKKHSVDFAILETGMGGRLDSTNVVDPIVSVITNIGLDHMLFLGSTIEQIALEKAGIIKQGKPVVAGLMRHSALQVIEKVAKEKQSPLYQADVQPTLFSSDLKGYYQHENIATTLAAISALQDYYFVITEAHIEQGLKSVVRNTNLQGRWQVLSNNPLTICDVGHNEDGVRKVLEQVRETEHKNLHMVWGMVGDKNIDDILDFLPKSATFYFCAADIPRALDAEKLAQQARNKGLSSLSYKSVQHALSAARSAADDNDLIFIGGSVFVVAEVL